MRMLLACLAVLFLLLPASVAAMPRCTEHDVLLAFLKERYSEAPVEFGVTNNGVLMELLTAPDGKTWSLIVTDGEGRSCLLVAGEGWRDKEPPGPRA